MSEILAYFQQIYIINLPYRSDRRREIAAELDRIGLCFESPGVRLFEAVRPEAPEGFTSIGARGCFLSHLAVLRDACEHGFERILILEDDVNFAKDFIVRMGEVKSALEHTNWSIFYGGYALNLVPKPCRNEAVVAAEPAWSIQNAHFVAFQGDTICAAVTYLETLLSRPPGDPNGGPMHVDGAYNWFRNQFPSKITLLSVSQLGYQRSSRTDIHSLRWFDRTPVFRAFVGVIRSLRNKRVP